MVLHSVSYGDNYADLPLVFLGSIASTTDMWLPQLDELSRYRRVIALDHRGHGSSQAPQASPGNTDIGDLAQEVLSTLDELGVDQFVIIGLSLGGAIAQHLALTSSRVERAVFMCTAPYFGGTDKWEKRSVLTRNKGMEPMADMVVSLWFSDEWKKRHPASTRYFREMITSTRGEGYASCADALGQWDIRERLEEITVPVLTIAGEEDQSTPPDTVHSIAAGTSGESRTVTVNGAHLPNIEAAAEVNRVLLGFLS